MTLTQINKAGLDELALDHVFTIGASGSSAYTFQGEGLNGTVNNPTLYLTRGKTYRFENGSGGHPIRIQSTSGASGTAYNTGVTNNAGSGTVIVEVQHDAPDVLYYQCTSHANMNGVLYITGALADGGVTTAKIADDAVTDAKLANSINTAIAANTAKTSLENNSVTTAKIADEAVTLAKLPHGTSSNDGKFLRANNGADPSFETITGTTINNNADNRVITGSGTANTLNGESSVVIDANGKLGIGTTSPDNILHLKTAVNNTAQLVVESTATDSYPLLKLKNDAREYQLTCHGGLSDAFTIYDGTSGNHRFIIDSSGNVGIGMTPAAPLHVTGSTADTLRLTNGSSTSIYYKIGRNHLDGKLEFRGTQSGDECYSFGGVSGEKIRFQPAGGISFNGDTAAANALDDYEEGTWTPIVQWSSGTGTAGSNNYGYYTKVGNVVHVHATVHWTAVSGATVSSARINGLPYVYKNASNYRATYVIASQIVGVQSGGTSSNIAVGSDASNNFLYITPFNNASTGGANYSHTPTINSSGIIYGLAVTYLTN